MRARGVIEYLGTGLAGWQVQPNAPSVQQHLEEALEIAVRVPCRVESAGRTDAGVHARGQVFAFDLPDGNDLFHLRASVNALTPRQIAIRSLEETHAAFDPRRDARSRGYSYVISNTRPASPFWSDRSWMFNVPMRCEDLNRVAAHLIGNHDFSAYRASDCQSPSVRRNVTQSEWTREGDILTYRIAANAFLKQMVRILVGSIVDVVLGNRSEEEFVRLLREGGVRSNAGRTAPPHGLSLDQVLYEEDLAGADDSS